MSKRAQRVPDYKPMRNPLPVPSLEEDLHARPDDETKYAPSEPGSFQRGACRVQHWVEEGSQFEPAAGRYHLFVNYGCGWCHQLMILRGLKGLEDAISLSHLGLHTLGVRGTESYKGWAVPSDPTGNGFQSTFDVYNCGDPGYGRAQLTIPILFDTLSSRVVSNDPAQILLMLNGSFQPWARCPLDLYPPGRRTAIEALNDVIFPGINDGVYRCWFASTPEAYTAAFSGLTEALLAVERVLERSEYLCGDQISLADVRAFPHLVRFDLIYHLLMLREPRGTTVASLGATAGWLERMHAHPAIKPTCDLSLAMRFYLGPQMSAQECTERYSSHKPGWMPSEQQLMAKRGAEQLCTGRLSKIRI